MNVYAVVYQHLSGDQYLHIVSETLTGAADMAIKFNKGAGYHADPYKNITEIREIANDVIFDTQQKVNTPEVPCSAEN